jgi:hypothetical protein
VVVAADEAVAGGVEIVNGVGLDDGGDVAGPGEL